MRNQRRIRLEQERRPRAVTPRMSQTMQHEPGIQSRIIPPQPTSKKKKPIAQGSEKVDGTQVAAIIDRRLMTNTAKYFEVLFTGVNMSTTGAFTTITAITQGPSQNERVADTIWLERIDLSYGITTGNADIFNLSRVTLLKWKVSDALALPTTAEVFSNWSNALVHSFLNFERRQLYAVFHDHKFNMTGTATDPTINSQHYVELAIPMNKAKIQFDQGVLTGTDKIYLFLGSDSSVLPFPVFNGNFRVWYYDAM